MDRAQALPSARPVRLSPVRLAPNWIDKGLAIAAGLMLAIVLLALARGRAQWGMIPKPVWLHLVTIIGALALTPVMLLRRRGDLVHRVLGWIWVACLFATALISFDIRPHGFSPIHLLSIFVTIQTPLIVVWARRHNVIAHRVAVRSTTFGALIIAGVFTFPFGRLLGRWLFG